MHGCPGEQSGLLDAAVPRHSGRAPANAATTAPPAAATTATTAPQFHSHPLPPACVRRAGDDMATTRVSGLRQMDA